MLKARILIIAVICSLSLISCEEMAIEKAIKESGLSDETIKNERNAIGMELYEMSYDSMVSIQQDWKRIAKSTGKKGLFVFLGSLFVPPGVVVAPPTTKEDNEDEELRKKQFEIDKVLVERIKRGDYNK